MKTSMINSKTMVLMARLTMTLIVLFASNSSLAKTKTVRKVQEVNFAELDLKGTVRNPDGAYLVQKRGIKFMPLYDIQKDMDSKIRESVQYVR